MTAELHTAIEIEASPDAVWRVLVDTASWPEWNTFIPVIEGRIQAGERLRIRAEPPGGRTGRFKPVVTEYEEGRRFTWVGSLPVPGLFTGAHSFDLEPLDRGRTRLRHFEEFRGLLVPVVWPRMERSTRKGFELMNDQLKNRVENG